jgi:outer membrane protein OmpA-like peptidoglycan-associated protein
MKIIKTVFTTLGAVVGVTAAALCPGIATADEHPLLPSSQSLGEVRFQFDSSALPADASQQLADVVAFASAHPDQRIVLDAHCDPIGSGAYNVGLAIRRAESVRHQLTTAGVAEEQVVFAIYGKNGERRPTYAEDRRVTLWPTRAPLTAVIDHTLDARGTAVTWSKPLSTAQIASAPEPVASR